MSARLCRRAVFAAVAATALLAAPAAAHPFVAGGELPVDSLATMTLTMAHGCGGDDGGEEAPTTEVALEVPDWLRIVEVADTAGYQADLETTEDGAVQTVVWTADGDGEPAPAFELDVVATGEEGDERYLSVFQACENDSYRWIGTPDEPADDPAIGVTLAAADPDAPPPPEEPPADDPEPTAPADDATTEEPDPTVSADEGATDDPDTAADDPAGEADPEDAASSDDAGGFPWWLVVAIATFVAVAVAVVGRRRRAGRFEGHGGDA